MATALGCATGPQPPAAGHAGVEQVRRSIAQCWVVTGITTAGYSEPCALCTVVA